MPAIFRRHPLAVLLLLAAALRIWATWTASVAHPDEIFQYLEQAHRLVFGYGIIPWEYREGMRSWLVPVLLAGPMWLGERVWPGTDAYLLLPRLTVALATLAVVWGAWSLGERVSRLHALLAAFVAAIWIDQVYFAAHTLTETIATAAAVPGVAMLWRAERAKVPATPVRPELVEGLPSLADRVEEKGSASTSSARTGKVWYALAFAGMLLAFAALVRFHYGPGLAVLVVWRCRLDWRAWGAVIAGAVPVLAVSIAVDLAAGMTPFSWVVANYRLNVVQNAAATYGVSGAFFYFAAWRAWWGVAFLPLVFLAFFGAQRFPALLVAAAIVVGLHMTIGHKELRFVLLAMTLMAVLAAFGTADLVRLAERGRAAWASAAMAAWIAATAWISLTGEMRFGWANEVPALAAARLAARGPGLCGFATYGQRYWQSGGYTFLHRRVPIYPLTASDELYFPPMTPATLRAIAPAFNVITTTPADAAAMPPGYRRVACLAPPAPLTTAAARAGRAICVYRRPGGCTPALAEPWRLK